MKTRVSLRLYTIALVAILMAAVACTKAPSDSQIATDIQNKLSADSGLQGKQLVVQATNGTVTLSGTVDNDTERDAAAKYASSEAGVKQVVNNLQVAAAPVTAEQQAPAPAPEAPAEETAKPSPSSRRHHRHSEKNEASTSHHDNDSNNMPMASNALPPPVNTPE
ncbi:MAG: BON domain-containing protein, partial [Terriglobales bacterium]